MNDKSERYVLSVLCAAVCIWSLEMVIGVVHLAYYQGAKQLLELLEVAAFMGAGLLPLIGTWRKSTRGGHWILWGALVCLAYVTFLAVNCLRLGLFFTGAWRLCLWCAIVALLIRGRVHRSAPKPV